MVIKMVSTSTNAGRIYNPIGRTYSPGSHALTGNAIYKPTTNQNLKGTTVYGNSGAMVVNQQRTVKNAGTSTEKKNTMTGADLVNALNAVTNSGSGIADLSTAAEDVLSGADSGTTGSSSGSSGTSSPLLSGEMTFEQLIGEICNGLDLVFIVKRSTVVLTDYESIYAEAKYLRDNYHDSVKSEDIALWQLQDGSYELDIQDYGFYNTVKVNYSNGTVTESIDNLVKAFGEVPITYDEPKIDKTTAIMKAKAYLAAHLREFEVSVKGDLLHDGDIDIGDIVTIENPLTLTNTIHNNKGEDSEYLFVTGHSINWKEGEPIMNSIETRFGPVSPEKLEVPEYGASYSNSSSGDTSSVSQLAQEIGSFNYSHSCSSGDCLQSTGQGDCWALSDYIYQKLSASGIRARIRQFATSSSSRHRQVEYMDSAGNWTMFPYGSSSINHYFYTNSIPQSASVIADSGG